MDFFKILVVLQELMLLVSAVTVLWNWHVTLVRLPIFLPISLGAQLLNQHHTCTSQHWQHGRMTPVSLGVGETILLISLFLHIPDLAAVSICH